MKQLKPVSGWVKDKSEIWTSSRANLLIVPQQIVAEHVATPGACGYVSVERSQLVELRLGLSTARFHLKLLNTD